MENNEQPHHEKTDAKLMFYLIRELWYDCDYGRRQIKNSGYRFFELSKGGFERSAIASNFKFLTDNGYVKLVTDNPPVYEFTPKGKAIQSQNDIDKILGIPR